MRDLLGMKPLAYILVLLIVYSFLIVGLHDYLLKIAIVACYFLLFSSLLSYIILWIPEVYLQLTGFVSFVDAAGVDTADDDSLLLMLM